jgi:hypothetical protein
MRGADTPTTFNPFGGSFLADPYPQVARFLASQPVFWSSELSYWVVSRYADARRVLRDYHVFSAANALAPVTPPGAHAGGALAAGGFRSIPTLTNVDPPAWCRSAPPTAIPRSSPIRIGSTSAGPTPTSTCRSGPDPTCAWARRWRGSRHVEWA